MNLPKSLTRFNKNLKSLPSESALFFFEDTFNDSLYVYKSKLQFKGDYMNIVGDRMQNLGWFVRGYYERSKDLWGSFSEEFIRDKLKDKKCNIYEIHCEQAFACTCRGIPSDAYILDMGNKKGLKDAFVFGANELLKKVSSAGFGDNQIKKLADFFYEDFTTMKHSSESRQIGIDADSVFFPG